MTKLKKQLIGLRIYRFFQANDLVLFFHCNSNTNKNWYAINTKFSSLNCAFQNAKQAKVKWQKLQEEPIAAQMTSLLLKNKVAQKVFAAYTFETRSSQAVRTLDKSKEMYEMVAEQKHKKGLQPPYFCVEEYQKTRKKKSIELYSSDTKILQNKKNSNFRQLFALFQGPTLLLAFNNILLLENLLNIYKQENSLENSLVLLGGFYNNNVLLNEEDVQRLAQLSKKNWNTLSFVKELKKSTQPSLYLLKKALDFSILNAPQHQFLRILHYRIQQLTLL